MSDEKLTKRIKELDAGLIKLNTMISEIRDSIMFYDSTNAIIIAKAIKRIK